MLRDAHSEYPVIPGRMDMGWRKTNGYNRTTLGNPFQQTITERRHSQSHSMNFKLPSLHLLLALIPWKEFLLLTCRYRDRRPGQALQLSRGVVTMSGNKALANIKTPIIKSNERF